MKLHPDSPKGILSLAILLSICASPWAHADTVALSSVTGTSQAAPYTTEKSIDGIVNAEGWGVYGFQFQSLVGVFTAAAPVTASQLQFSLFQSFGGNHHIQEFRISTTTDAVPSEGGTWVPILPALVSASGGPTLADIGGGFMQATGTAAGGVIFQVIADGAFDGVTGFRLEMNPYDYDTGDALAASIGRSANGNMVLSEFVVTTDGDFNWALGQPVGFFDTAGSPVAQYSTAQAAANITDGNVNSIGHPTGPDNDGYYARVDLGVEVYIDHLDMTGRLSDDCCDDRLEGYALEFYAADGTTLVGSMNHAGQTKATEMIPVSGLTGPAQFVHVVNSTQVAYGPQIGEIAVFGGLAPPNTARFEITEISANPVDGATSLTFNSTPNTTYKVWASSDARGAVETWEEIDDTVPSDGTETTYVFTDTTGIGQPVRVYRVERNVPAP